MLTDLELREEAVEYITLSLSAGRKLVRGLLNLPIVDGRVRSFLPIGLSSREIRAYSDGGVLSKLTTRNAIDSQLAAFVLDFLGGHNCGYLIAQDFNSTPGNPWLRANDSKYFTIADEVYLFLSSYSADNESIIATIHEGNTANSILNISFLSLLPENLKIELGQEISPATIQELIQNTQHIIVEAFDGEGVLLWSRS